MDDMQKASDDFDKAHGELVALANHSEFLEALESFAKTALPVALELGLELAPGGSGIKTLLAAVSSKLPAVLAKLA